MPSAPSVPTTRPLGSRSGPTDPAPRNGRRRGARLIHPVAWWAWALGLAAAATRTTNPALLLLIVGVLGFVVRQRREVGQQNTFLPFLLVGLLAIGLRMGMTVLLGNGVSGRVVLLSLPRVTLPTWFGGVHLGGPITAESVVAALVDGLRLATTLVCIGAANALAPPRRLLRYTPASLHDVGTAVVVALTYAPQMIHHARQVRSARRLRGRSGHGPVEFGRLAVPVLAGSLERSLDLAASMESRGYGRVAPRAARAGRLGGLLAVVGMAGVVAGLYGMLASDAAYGPPTVLAGSAVAGASLAVGARHDVRTRYRRDPWAWPEWTLCGLGALVAAVFVVADSAGWAGMTVSQVPLAWPELPTVPALCVCAAALAAVVAPVPPRLAAARRATSQAGSTAPHGPARRSRERGSA